MVIGIKVWIKASSWWYYIGIDYSDNLSIDHCYIGINYGDDLGIDHGDIDIDYSGELGIDNGDVNIYYCDGIDYGDIGYCHRLLWC